MNVRFLLIRKLKLPAPFWPSGPVSKRRKAVVVNPQSRRSSRIQSVAVPRRIGVPNTLFNNQRWQAVRRATVRLAREGFAAKNKHQPITFLDSISNYQKAVEVADGYGEKVTDPGEMMPALERGLRAVNVEKRQAVINVICSA